MRRIRWDFPIFWLPGLVLIAAVWLGMSSGAPVAAAEPMATATPTPKPTPCEYVATAETIRIYRCMDEQEGYMFYVNNLGFMLAEP